MIIFKKILSFGKIYLQKPETRLVIGMVGGGLIGVGTENLALGIALAVSLGVSGYVSGRKDNKDDDVDANKSE